MNDHPVCVKLSSFLQLTMLCDEKAKTATKKSAFLNGSAFVWTRCTVALSYLHLCE